MNATTRALLPRFPKLPPEAAAWESEWGGVPVFCSLSNSFTSRTRRLGAYGGSPISDE